MVWERGWLLATLLVYLLWSLVAGGEEPAAADPVLGWMEAGEIHSDSYFVYLHVFHFNFLGGGEVKHFRNSLKYICLFTSSPAGDSCVWLS